MRAFLRDLWELLQKHVKVLAALGVALVVLVLVLNFAVSRMARRSSFCVNCHYMAPYVEQWKTSTHAGVDCVQCHPYGSVAVAASTLRYLSGAYNPRPRVEVDDKSCLAGGCHDQRLLKAQETFRGGIRFDHQVHLKTMPRGIQLRCTSCHNQIVQKGHVTVTEQVCYTCHFKGAGAGQAVTGCETCHGKPKKLVEHAGFSFSHESYLKIGVACSQCHVQVVTGDAGVAKERCATCHVGREERIKDVQFLHENHIARHKVDCQECHAPIRHGKVQLVEPLEVRCESCHIRQHSLRKLMYIGTGGKLIPDLPSRMFAAQVSCTGCHIHVTEKGAVLSHEARTTAQREACVTCHDSGYDKMYDDWKLNMAKLVQGYAGYLTEAEKRVMGKDLPKRHATALKDAREAYLFVKDGRGEHNVEYAVKLLQTGAARVDALLAALDPKAKPIPRDDLIGQKDGYCFPLCHQRLPFKADVILDGKKLPHQLHADSGVGCGTCHSVSKHKALAVDRAACKACHPPAS
jgi:nitrate/TMAO reductase-like tetraheme cytochrome c subunit